MRVSPRSFLIASVLFMLMLFLTNNNFKSTKVTYIKKVQEPFTTNVQKRRSRPYADVAAMSSTKMQPELHRQDAEKARTKVSRVNNKKQQQQPASAVLVISQFRSGSSIIGELFNQNEHVTYLFEPLMPLASSWRPVHRALVPKSVRAVEKMVRCEFRELPKLYEDALKFIGKTDFQG